MPSWGASRFTVALAGAWFIASPGAGRVRVLAFPASLPWVPRVGPWFVLTLAGVMEYSLALAGVAVLGHGPNLAHGLGLLMAVPLAAACTLARREPRGAPPDASGDGGARGPAPREPPP